MIWSGSGMLIGCVSCSVGVGDGTMVVVGSWWKREGVEGKEEDGRSASYRLSLEG